MPSEVVALVRKFGEVGVECDHGILRTQIGRVVDANIHLSNLARRMEEALQGVIEEHARTERHLQALDGRHDRSQHVRAGLKDVGPHQIEQMLHALLVTQSKRAESQMMNNACRRLSMHVVSVGERVVQAANDRVDVVFAHLADVFKHPAQRLETAVAHVELRCPILVEDGRDGGEGPARLGHDGNRHRRANTRLSLLHAQIGQKHLQHVRRSDGTRNVAKAVHRSSADGLLVRLEQIQQLKADAHPLARTDELGAFIGDPADEVDARFLHLLVTIAQDGRHTREQILDGRAHLRHADHVGDGRLGADDRCQSLGELLSQLLEQDHTKFGQQSVFSALLDDQRQLGGQVSGLLTRLCALVVQTPQNGRDNLREVGLDTQAQRVDHRADAIEHDVVFDRLLLEGVDETVDELHLEALVDVGRAQVGDDLLDGLHHHLAERLAFVLELVDDPRHNLGNADLVGQLHRSLDDLPVVTTVQRHSAHPEVL